LRGFRPFSGKSLCRFLLQAGIGVLQPISSKSVRFKTRLVEAIDQNELLSLIWRSVKRAAGR